MTARTRWYVFVGGCALLLGIFLQIPQLLYQIQPEARGILVHLNSDEHQYLARLEQVLIGDPGHAAEPFTGDPNVRGLHLPLIEQIEGLLFSWTGWRSATVLQVMDSVVPSLLFLGMVLFFRLSGFTRKRSFFGALLFILPLLYSLNRPIHQRTSFLLVLSAILLALLALEHRNILIAIPAGIVLGILVGVYFWSWTFAWTYVGLLGMWEGMQWLTLKPRPALPRSPFGFLLIIVVVGVLAALPFILETVYLLGDPLGGEAAFRQGVHASRLPESWVYSVLFLLMSAGLLVAAWRRPSLRGPTHYALLVPIAAFVVLNQQLVHGQVFLFFSHYAFPLAFGAVCAVIVGSLLLSRWLLLPLMCGVVILLGIVHDNRYVLTQFAILPERFMEQHLSSLLPVLDALPRSTILSDVSSSAFVAGSTSHDVLYSIYFAPTLMPSREIARRYCMTQLPLPPELRHIPEQEHLVWPDADRAHPGGEVRGREVQMVEEECAHVDQDPVSALKEYHVQYVLWDEKRWPRWDFQRLTVPLERVAGEAESWSLYRVPSIP